MGIGRATVAVATCLGISGCATTSFSPPPVSLQYAPADNAKGAPLSWRCAPEGEGERIGPDVKGALNLIDNFVYAYRCAGARAANGRQYFEVPGLLVGVGIATAAALSAGTTVAIAGGATAATIAAGGHYYDPKAKSALFSSALDAVLCIKTEAVGLDPVTLKDISDVEAEAGKTRQQPDNSSGPGVVVTSKQQYFQLVSAALLSVDRVLGQRLSNVGSYDAAGVIAEIKTISDQIKADADKAKAEADAKAKNLAEEAGKSGAGTSAPATETANATGTTTTETTTTTTATGATSGGNKAVTTTEQTKSSTKLYDTTLPSNVLKNLNDALSAGSSANAVVTKPELTSETIVKLYTLGPKLQQCVVRAKI